VGRAGHQRRAKELREAFTPGADEVAEEAIREAAALDDPATAHVLRHTCATILVRRTPADPVSRYPSART
jgi:integrase